MRMSRSTAFICSEGSGIRVSFSTQPASTTATFTSSADHTHSQPHHTVGETLTVSVDCHLNGLQQGLQLVWEISTYALGQEGREGLREGGGRALATICKQKIQYQ